MYSAGFHLDPVKDVPQDVQLRAAGVSLELEQEDLREAQSLGGSIRRLSTEYQKELRSIIGPENLENYFAFRGPLRQHVRKTMDQAKPTVVGERQVRDARRRAAEESREFLKKIGFDMASASELRGRYHTRMQKVVSEALGRPKEPNYLVLPDVVPMKSTTLGSRTSHHIRGGRGPIRGTSPTNHGTLVLRAIWTQPQLNWARIPTLMSVGRTTATRPT
jgi:hypothetical protein